MKRTIAEHGSLEALFAAGHEEATTMTPSCPAWSFSWNSCALSAGGPEACPSLLSSPADGSACKRLNLYLRWMVRRDAWIRAPGTTVPRSKLVVPLDTHMFRIARALGPDAETAGQPAHGRGDHEGIRAAQPPRPGALRFLPDAAGDQPAHWTGSPRFFAHS